METWDTKTFELLKKLVQKRDEIRSEIVKDILIEIEKRLIQEENNHE